MTNMPQLFLIFKIYKYFSYSKFYVDNKELFEIDIVLILYAVIKQYFILL